MNYDADIKEKVITSLIWKLSERIGVQAVQFIIQVVLARLLLPETFGSIAIINVFILVFNVLVQYGFSTALIQKKSPDHLDYSSVCYVNIIISFIMYIIIYFSAPWISLFYNDVTLVPLFRIQALILFPGAISGVQNSFLSKHMDFKKSFYINFGAVILQGIAGIILAINGYGIWALIIAQNINAISLMILGFMFIKWYPKREFSIERIKSMFMFGKNILSASLMETIFNNIYSLAIGKVYSQKILGYYNRGQSIPSMLMNTINGSIQGVLFPALSNNQDDKEKIKSMMRRAIRTSSYLIFPIMFLIISCASNIIVVLLTDKWLPSVFFLRLSCLAMAVYPIHTANLQAISAIGRSDIYLRLEIIKKIVLIIILVLTLPLGIKFVMLGSVLCSWISIFINSYPNKNLLNYSMFEQIKDLCPSFLLSFLMGIIVFCLNRYLHYTEIVNLCIQIIAGGFFYLVSSFIFNMEELKYIINTIEIFIKKREKK